MKRHVTTTISIVLIIVLACSVLISCSGEAPAVETPAPTASVTPEPQPTPVKTPAPRPVTDTGETDWEAVLERSNAVVYLTINPEVALYVDENNFVICGDCLNDDARDAYSNINFYGATIDECTKLVIEAAIDRNYLTSNKDVKVDVAALNDSADTQAIKKTTQDSVNETAAGHNMSVNVVVSDFDGQGKVICFDCDGTGYEPRPCPVYCDHPGNMHEFRHELAEVQINNPNWCRYCQGQGTFLCEVCKGDYSSTCDGCEGTGITPCGMCMENGPHKKGVCAVCYGEGMITP